LFEVFLYEVIKNQKIKKNGMKFGRRIYTIFETLKKVYTIFYN